MISAFISAHVQACLRAFKRIIAAPLATLISTLVIGIAIMLPLGLYSLFSNITSAASRLNTEPNVNVYLQVTAKDEEAREIEKRLQAMTNVANVKFISREAALTEMKRVASVADLLNGLDNNPLPHAFTLRPRTTEAAALEQMRKDITALPKVDAVVMDFEWAKKLKRFATFAERLVMLLGAVLALAVVFVTGNTIRLQILTQKDEIEVSRLIGATKRFVRRPFLYFGALQGALAGGVAVLAIVALTWWAGKEIQALTISYGSDFQLQYATPEQIIGIIAIGAFLGWLGAYLSVSMYLRSSRTA
jgi:cell division transport system permease protein